MIEDSGDALHLLWAATAPFLRDGTTGPAEPTITRCVVELIHAFLESGGSSAAEALVASGAVGPVVYVSYLVIRSYPWNMVMVLLGILF